MSSQTHIEISIKPQPMDKDFDKNMEIAERQKAVAEAAPEMLAVLEEIVSQLGGKGYCAVARARAVLGRAKGEQA